MRSNDWPGPRTLKHALYDWPGPRTLKHALYDWPGPRTLKRALYEVTRCRLPGRWRPATTVRSAKKHDAAHETPSLRSF